MKYNSYKKDKVILLSVWTPGLTDPPHVMLDTVHTVFLLHCTRPDVHSIDYYLLDQPYDHDHDSCYGHRCFTRVQRGHEWEGMTDVTVTALHHTPRTGTPGTVTMMATNTDAVVVRLHREVEMQVHTPGPVLTSSLLKGMHTPTLQLSLAAVERQTSATASQPQDDSPQLTPHGSILHTDSLSQWTAPGHRGQVNHWTQTWKTGMAAGI